MMIRKAIRKYVLMPAVFLTVLEGVILAGAAAAAAQTPAHFTEQEKAVLSYYKLSGVKHPDFAPYVLETGRYKKTPEKERKKVFEQEMHRMQWGMESFDPGANFLNIKTAVEVKLAPPQGGKSVLSFQFPNEGSDYIPYFPYQLGREWIALLVEDLPAFSRMELTPAQFAFIERHIPADGQPYPALLRMEVRPVAADNGSPFELGGYKQWLMMGDIASLKFNLEQRHNGEEITLWEYGAEWHSASANKELLPLLELKR